MIKQTEKEQKKWMQLVQKAGKLCRKDYIAAFLFGFFGMAGYAQTDIIPKEVISTGEAFRNIFLGDIGRIILGCIWGGACIAFAFHKDSTRGKTAFIIITVCCFGLGLTTTLINKFTSMGK